MNEEEKKAIEYYQDKEISIFGIDFDTKKLLKAIGITEEDSFENHQIRFKTLLKLIEKLQKENEELKTELERQKDINTIINQKRIDKNYEKVLEKSMSKFLKTNMAKDFIPVQKVKDKIEELNKKEKIELKGIKGTDRYYIKQIYMYQITILQELLEGRK